MEEHRYKGVTIQVFPGSINASRRGRFTLSWPGHEESVESMYGYKEYVLDEAQTFVDTWIDDGYIQLEEQ